MGAAQGINGAGAREFPFHKPFRKKAETLRPDSVLSETGEHRAEVRCYDVFAFLTCP